MKMDIKSILILVLLGLSLIFGSMWYFRGDNSKKELKKLQDRYNEIEKLKKDSDIRLIDINKELISLYRKDSLSIDKISKLENGVKIAEADASKSKANLNKLRAELEKTKKSIDDLKNNPTNRTGDDLLESLKNKTK